MNASAEKGSLSSNFLSTSSFEFGFVPLIDKISLGLGKKSITASNNGWTPLFLKADPVKTGTKSNFRQPFLIHAIKSFSVGWFKNRKVMTPPSGSITLILPAVSVFHK